MISYELAKKLKDAGYPQSKEAPAEVFADNEKGPGFFILRPTLSELLMACFTEGKMFSRLACFQGKWRAAGFHNKKDIVGDTISDTPEEAVAKLWLVLQANPKST